MSFTNRNEQLRRALEERCGLYNVRPDWICQHSTLSADQFVGPIVNTDLSKLTQGTIPWDISRAHSIQLGTKALVQIDDIINIANANPRSSDAPRVLQLTLTDGVQDFIGVELEPLQRVSMGTVPGTKLVLHETALFRRGRVMLTSRDFTFLGCPTTSQTSNIVWGEQYEERISTALSEAGLPNPRASTFDTIASSNSQLLVDMGGIADAANIADDQENDDDDDAFWAEAAAIADLSEAQVVNGGGGGGGQGFAQGNGDVVMHGNSNVRTNDRRDEETNLLNTRGDPLTFGTNVEMNPSRDTTCNLPATVALMDVDDEPQPQVIEPDYTPGEKDIPDMPYCESDAIVINSDDDFEDVGHSKQQNDNLVEVFGEMVAVPQRPFSYFCNIEDELDRGRKQLVVRAFAPRPQRKPKARQVKGGLAFSVPFDDGTEIFLAAVGDKFFGDLAGFSKTHGASTSSSDGASNGSAVSNPFLDSPKTFSNTILKYSRALIGFMQVDLNSDVAVLKKVSREPPQGYVSVLSFQFFSNIDTAERSVYVCRIVFIYMC